MRRIVDIGDSLKDYMCAVLGVEWKDEVRVELIDSQLGEHRIAHGEHGIANRVYGHGYISPSSTCRV